MWDATAHLSWWTYTEPPVRRVNRPHGEGLFQSLPQSKAQLTSPPAGPLWHHRESQCLGQELPWRLTASHRHSQISIELHPRRIRHAIRLCSRPCVVHSVHQWPAPTDSNFKLFADDTICQCSISTEEDQAPLQNDLDKFSVWKDRWN